MNDRLVALCEHVRCMRESFDAANREREQKGLAPAYGEEAYFDLAEIIRNTLAEYSRPAPSTIQASLFTMHVVGKALNIKVLADNGYFYEVTIPNLEGPMS